MSRPFDAKRYYFVLEAFDRLGERVYRDEWTGMEAWAEPGDGLEERQAEINKLKAELRENTAQHESLRLTLNPNFDSEDRDVTQKRLNDLRKRATEIDNQLRAIPPINRSSIRDDAMHKRRYEVTAILHEAFYKRQIDLRFGANRVVEWDRWSREPDFKLNIELSSLGVPADFSPDRKMVAFLVRKEFDVWLGTIRSKKPVPDSQEEREEMFLAKLRNADSSNHSRMRKRDWQEIAMKDFGMSKQKFLTLWSVYAPAELTEAGRPLGS